MRKIWKKEQESSTDHERRGFFGQEFENMTFSEILGLITSEIHIGTLTLWGSAANNFHTHGQTQELTPIYSMGRGNGTSQCMQLTTRDKNVVEVKAPFHQFYTYLSKNSDLGKISYFCCVPKEKKNQEKQSKIKDLQERALELIK